MAADETEDIDSKDRRLCVECVADVYLRTEMQRSGCDGVCFYCHREAKTFSIDGMADVFESALNDHFYRTATEPSGFEYAMMKEGEYYWERKGDPVSEVISECAGIEPEPARDIRGVLEDRNSSFDDAMIGEENPFDEDAHYSKKGVEVAESRVGWLDFEQRLKTQERYFSRTAAATLTSIFEEIADYKSRKGRPIIVNAGPGRDLRKFYRARVFQSDDKLEEALKRPEKEVGPPPPLAATAGRMNARGIAVFYGATDPAVALAEVRPPVGSKVVVGGFEIIRPIRLLDVEALRSLNITGSIFDRVYIKRLERAAFLRWLSQRITMAVMPDDEPFDYLATQAIADFLATEGSAPLDGILYPSAQGREGNLNVVLFHKAACVQAMDIPEATEISAHLGNITDDGWEVDYSVSEEVRAEEPSAPFVNLDSPLSSETRQTAPKDYHGRAPTLRLDLPDIQVHHVTGVAFQTEAYSVTRNRFDKRSAPF